MVYVRFSISSCHSGDQVHTDVLFIKINITVISTILVLLSCVNKSMLPLVTVRIASLVTFLYVWSTSLSLVYFSHTYVLLRRTSHLTLQPINRTSGLQLLSFVTQSAGPGWAKHRISWEPPTWCILNLSRDMTWWALPRHWEAETVKCFMLHRTLHFFSSVTFGVTHDAHADTWCTCTFPTHSVVFVKLCN